jgi:hypothetical protein
MLQEEYQICLNFLLAQFLDYQFHLEAVSDKCR